MKEWHYIIPTVVGGFLVYLGYYVKAHVDRNNQQKIDELKADRAFLSDISEVLPTNSAAIEFIKNHNFYLTYKLEQITPFKDFKFCFCGSDKFFHNSSVDASFKSLQESIDQFVLCLDELSSPIHFDFYTCLRRDYHSDDDLPTEVEQEIKKIESLATRVSEKYESFIFLSKKELKI